MSTELGRLAEDQAADYIAKLGFRVIDRNWRNRWCEIDIVAEFRGRVHFIEVKYRRSHDFGSGFDYITKAKATRLRRAALSWLADHQLAIDYQIDVIAVTKGQVDYLASAVEAA